MSKLLLLAFSIALVVTASPEVGVAASSEAGIAAPGEPGGRWVAKKRRKRRKPRSKRRRDKKPRRDKQEEKLAPKPGAIPSSGSGSSGGALDLSGFGDDDVEKGRQEMLGGSGGDAAGSFDFGGGAEVGGELDFGGELGGFDFGSIEVSSAERDRFDNAMELMSDEDYEEAALEFQHFLQDPKFAEFKHESEYQLAKALYKLGLWDPALKHFKTILDQGASHRRYRKSIEWLFFISRRMADETPVLAELARFRNVTFPKAYRDEYRYLLGKYLFVQAERFLVEIIKQKELERGKKSKEAGIDFSAIADAMAESEDGSFDFGSMGEGFDIGGGGGDGLDFGGGGFDFGSGGEGDGGGFDFGTEGGFDFGAGPTKEKAVADGPVRAAGPASAKDAITQGLEFVGQVSQESRFYSKAKYLEGLLHYVNDDAQSAVNSFQDVVRMLNPRTSTQLDPGLRELAFLSLARIHYGYNQFNRSVYYYDMIDRDSENWLTALFEASWAYYRRGDFEKALGNLLTLHSPFFEREYFPESKIVKAIIYFEACRYAETRQIVDGFLGRFTRVMKEIERVAGSKESPELLYDRIAQRHGDTAEGGDEDVTARVVNLALQDSDIRRARDVVLQLQDQLELWRETDEEFRQSRLGSQLHEDLRGLRVTRSREAGEVTRRRFEHQLYALKSLLAQALRIKLEVATAERQALQRQLAGEADPDALVPPRERTVVDDEHLYWPYEGEYWRDELGTYELDFAMCHPLATD